MRQNEGKKEMINSLLLNKDEFIVYDSVTRYGPQSAASATWLNTVTLAIDQSSFEEYRRHLISKIPGV